MDSIAGAGRETDPAQQVRIQQRPRCIHVFQSVSACLPKLLVDLQSFPRRQVSMRVAGCLRGVGDIGAFLRTRGLSGLPI